MPPSLEMMSCPHLAVPAEVMQYVVHVESSHNPFAIGVVDGQLVRQPQNLGEAIATVRMLEEQGYNFSVGIAQVNRNNLGKYGLDTYEKAFDACANLAAGSRILAECYASSGNDWGKAFSCYYSGNFVTGYRDGYVQKIYDSISQSLTLEGRQVAAIPVAATHAATKPSAKLPINGSEYLIAMRSVSLDTAANAVVAPIAARAANVPSAQLRADATAHDASVPLTASNTVANDIFVPQVRGPNDPVTSSATSQAAVSVPVDSAELHQGARDEAFVF